MKIESSRQTCAAWTDGQTAPVGAKNVGSKGCLKMLIASLYPHDLLTNDGQADPVVFGGALSEVHSAGELA